MQHLPPDPMQAFEALMAEPTSPATPQPVSHAAPLAAPIMAATLEEQLALPGWWRRMDQAELLSHGIPEAPLAVMRYVAYKRWMPKWSDLDESQRRDYRTLCACAHRAKPAPHIQEAYDYRNQIRQAGGDPGPWTPPEKLVTRETAEQRDQRLAKMLAAGELPDPKAYMPGIRSHEAIMKRRELEQDRRDALALQRRQRETSAQQLRDDARVRKALERELDRLDAASPRAQELRAEVHAMRCHARYRLSWVDRVAEDMVTMVRLGRSTPAASRHRLAATALHMRPHHWTGD